MDEQFTLFWDGSLSQWHDAWFEIDGVEYCCAEQYMMAMKALTFGDHDTHRMIMETESPRQQKALGRVVDDFDEDIWQAEEDNGMPYCWNVVYRGNLAKFTQNPDLAEELLATAGTTIVEASPEDCLWGIGRGVDDPLARERAAWRGENWLGEVLMAVRDALMVRG